VLWNPLTLSLPPNPICFQSTGSCLDEFVIEQSLIIRPTKLSNSLLGPHESIPSELSRDLESAQLRRELDRVYHVYNDLLLSMNDEIQRCYEILQSVGLDCEGNPLPRDEDVEAESSTASFWRREHASAPDKQNTCQIVFE